MFSIRVLDRNNGTIAPPALAKIKPLRWSGDLLGGPRSAEIRIDDVEVKSLLPLTAWLGYKIHVVDSDGMELWWGDIDEVTITRNGVERGVTLAGMANRLKILYTVLRPGGGPSAAETDWAENTLSQSLYGLREMRYAASTEMTAAQAVQLRTTLLTRVSLPQPVRKSGGGSGDETFATLRCVGMVNRLKQVYFANVNGLNEHVTSETAWPLGLGFVSSSVAYAQRDRKYSIHQIFGRLEHFGEYDGLQVRITGSSFNDGTYTVSSGDAKDAFVYTGDTLEFNPGDDIIDSDPSFGLAPFEPGDVIEVAGSAHNSGTHLVKTLGTNRIEISPGYAGAPGPTQYIVHESPGPTITIQRGNKIEVEEPVDNEHIGPSTTVEAYGQRIYQTFVGNGSAAWTAHYVEIMLRKVGVPTDGVMVSLTTDSAGTPGTILETITVDDAEIDTELGWIAFEFGNTVSLTPATTYGILVRRSASLVAAHSFDYYEVGLDNNAGYSLGALKMYDGAAWQDPAEAKSLCFRVLGGVDTARQVQGIINATGQYGPALVEDLSGLATNQYREGKNLALDEIEALLDTGLSSGTRLVMTVMRTEHVRIAARAAASTAQLIARTPTALVYKHGQALSPGVLPVGEWVEDDDAYMLTGALASLSPFYVERAEYSIDGGWSLEPEGQPDPWAVGEVGRK